MRKRYEYQSINWCNFTDVDHAVELADGKIYGNSFGLSAELSCNLDPEEQVMVDFSKGKKLIKSYVDCQTNGPTDMRYGIDHKLWRATVEPEFENKIKITNLAVGYDFPVYQVGEVFPFVGSRKNWKDKSIKEQIEALVRLVLARAEDNLNAFLSKELGKKVRVSLYMDNTTPRRSVSLNNTQERYDTYERHSFASTTFRYTHGLPNSSSICCQNMVHGHLSSINLHLENWGSTLGKCENLAEFFLEKVWGYFGLSKGWENTTNVHFVNGRDLKNAPIFSKASEDGVLSVDVKTKDRGQVTYSADDKVFGNIIMLTNEETTVENLLNPVFMPALRSYLLTARFTGKFRVELTEGLNKGSIVDGKILL